MSALAKWFKHCFMQLLQRGDSEPEFWIEFLEEYLYTAQIDGWHEIHFVGEQMITGDFVKFNGNDGYPAEVNIWKSKICSP